MLPKKTESWDVKDLRTIVLLDSEANHTYKLILREATRAVKHYTQISPEQ